MQYEKAGQPHKLTEDVYIKFMAYVRMDISVANAARVARVHPETSRLWMERGYKESLAGLDTLWSKFFVDVRENQGLKISELLHKVENGPKNWQAIAWKLEKCFAEDFGKDSELYKQLLEDYKKLVQDMIDIKSNPPQGANGNGQAHSSEAKEDSKE